LALGRDTTVCTIYNGNLAADQARLARVALRTFDVAAGKARKMVNFSILLVERLPLNRDFESDGQTSSVLWICRVRAFASNPQLVKVQ
jgi:hypothetical protein